MNLIQNYFVKEATDKARSAFLELEALVNSHRESNRIPTLGASDIQSAAMALVASIAVLKRHGGLEDEAPLIDENLDSGKTTLADIAKLPT